MKSVGISVVMAQAGFYVPAVELKLGLYSKLFTRIASKDNLYKGLSTFSVETIELKNIFNREEYDTLIYNRVLQLGMGDSLYGLEFASHYTWIKNFYLMHKKYERH